MFNQRRAAILLVWAVLVAIAIRPLSIGVRMIRQPSIIRNETYPGKSIATMPSTGPEAVLANMMRTRRLEWEAGRAERLQQAESQYAAGIAVTALAGTLIAAWSYIAVRLWRRLGS